MDQVRTTTRETWMSRYRRMRSPWWSQSR